MSIHVLPTVAIVATGKLLARQRFGSLSRRVCWQDNSLTWLSSRCPLIESGSSSNPSSVQRLCSGCDSNGLCVWDTIFNLQHLDVTTKWCHGHHGLRWGLCKWLTHWTPSQIPLESRACSKAWRPPRSTELPSCTGAVMATIRLTSWVFNPIKSTWSHHKLLVYPSMLMRPHCTKVLMMASSATRLQDFSELIWESWRY